MTSPLFRSGFFIKFSVAFGIQKCAAPLLETKSAAQGRGSGDLVKHHILGKASILYGSGTLFYTCRFPGPLGKGYGVR